MKTLDNVPDSVQTWLKTQGRGLTNQQINEILAPDVAFTFAGKTIVGIPALLESIAAMPAGMNAPMEFSVLPEAAHNEYTIRATGTNGAPLPSPGGLMSAMDFKFTVNELQQISGFQPIPHHTEPGDLGRPMVLGEVAKPFTLEDVQGAAVTFSPEKHAASVVIFTCNPCPWALGWHDRIQDVVKDYADKNVQFLQINANDPDVSPKDAVTYSRQRVDHGDFAGPYLTDDNQQVAKALGARHTPDVFVFNQQGRLAYHGAPDEDYDNETLRANWLRAGIDAALAGKQPALPETQPTGCTIKWKL